VTEAIQLRILTLRPLSIQGMNVVGDFDPLYLRFHFRKVGAEMPQRRQTKLALRVLS